MAGLNFASGQFCFEHRLNASSVKEGEGALIVLMPFAFPRRSNVAYCTSVTMSISPTDSARSTASSLPYLMYWISSNFGAGPRKFGLRVSRMIRLRLNSVVMYGPLPPIGTDGLYVVVSSLTECLP